MEQHYGVRFVLAGLGFIAMLGGCIGITLARRDGQLGQAEAVAGLFFVVASGTLLIATGTVVSLLVQIRDRLPRQPVPPTSKAKQLLPADLHEQTDVEDALPVVRSRPTRRR